MGPKLTIPAVLMLAISAPGTGFADGSGASGTESAAEGLKLLRPPTAVIQDRRIAELSSIAPAAAAGEFWCANDSGHPPVLYRINSRGDVLQAVALRGAENIDWEAMARDDRGRIFLFDAGDNLRRRKNYTVYVVAEPAADVESVEPDATIGFGYADGESRDCEAAFVLGGNVYLISRNFQGAPAEVFRLDSVGASTAEARLVTRLGVRLPVTDAAYSRSRNELAVLTYGGVVFFRVGIESDLNDASTGAIMGYFGQAEAVCYERDTIILANEQGQIWRLPLEAHKENE